MYLERSHPVRVLLDAAANGSPPTRAQLEALAEHDRLLPEGASLARFRDRIARASEELVSLHSKDGGIGRSLPRAAELAADLADRMTEDERAADGDPNAEELDTITKRLFSH